MNLLYLANIRVPTERAHGAQILKMCEAFVRQGAGIRLMVPRRKNLLQEDPFAYYGLQERFPIESVPLWDTINWGRIGFWFESLQFALRSALRVAPGEYVYGRDEIVLFVVGSLRRNPLAWESHTGAWNFFARRLARRAERIVVISQGLKDFYVQRGIPEEKILVAHDGVDVSGFAHPESAHAARARLGLPQDKKIALYIGGLGGWKGMDTLYAAAALLPSSVVLAVIGGEKNLSALQAQHPHIMFLGFRPYRELADNQAAADVLVLPNTGKDVISQSFTSPLKLFSYLASGKPVVASDLPSIREVVSKKEAFLVSPDEPRALAEAIVQASAGGEEAAERARNAQKIVMQYDWQKRATHIISFLSPQKIFLPAGDALLKGDTSYLASSQKKTYFAYPSADVPRFLIPADDAYAKRFVLTMLSADKGLAGILLRGALKIPGGSRAISSLLFRERIEL